MGRVSVSQMLASPGYCLWQLLVVCEAEGLEFPTNTGHIVCDSLCLRILRQALVVDGETIAAHVIEDAFMGLPVKQAWGVAGSALKIGEITERHRMLVNYAKKRRRRDAEKEVV